MGTKVVTKYWKMDAVSDGIKSLRPFLSKLSESERRTIYGCIVDHITNNEDYSFSNLKIPSSIKSDREKKTAYTNLISQLERLVSEIGSMFIWSCYEQFVEGSKLEDLGQYFTPERIVEEALKGLTKTPKTILDPMAGHGVFLKIAKDMWSDASLTGVEIDNLPLNAANMIFGNKAELINDDVFSWSVKKFKRKNAQGYDVVVGNPAFVSYQNLRKIPTIYKNDKNTDYSKFLIKSIETISKQRGLSKEITKLLKEWSGYSDLAAYVTLLAWLITKHDGEFVFVMSNHWMEREYGAPLRKFLVSKGVVRGIVSHRGGNWFPRAQIPTSIMVYSKNVQSKRQNRLGVPHVEVLEDEGIDSLNLIGKKGFWEWLDDVTKPGNYGPVKISFLDWNLNNPEKNSKLLPDVSRGLTIPTFLSKTIMVSLDSMGWQARQGLRTGCNEFFYLRKKDGDKKAVFEAKITKTSPEVIKQMQVPSKYVIPTIHKIPVHHSLQVDKDDTDLYLLNLQEDVLEEDFKTIQSYPTKWRKYWNVKNISSLPHDLTDYIRIAGELHYVGSGTSGKKIKELSAVKTNCVIPRKVTNKQRQPKPRFWYQISLKYRHFGKIIIPRVNGGPVKSYLVKSDGDLVTDANFVTFIPTKQSTDRKKLWIWFNSNTFRLLCEINGVKMGGGALKVETALISKLPIPNSIKLLSTKDIQKTYRKLNKASSINDVIESGFMIDQIIFGPEIASEVKDTLLTMINQRKRRS